MLPKLWKKVLLAICIVACIYNVMSKLVNRNSLEVNLKSVDDGTTVFNLFQKKEKTVENGEVVDNINEDLETNNKEINSENEQNLTEETKEVSETPVEDEPKQKNKKTEFIVLY